MKQKTALKKVSVLLEYNRASTEKRNLGYEFTKKLLSTAQSYIKSLISFLS